MPKAAACTLYHNPRCSKSRATLDLLREHGVEPTVVEYLRTPPSARELKSILSKLKLSPAALLRRGEEAYAAKIAGRKLTEGEIVATMVENPVLIERPIVVMGTKAVIGRPPENVLQLLERE
jgi:arsenate reductase (glutaredoxin)